MPTELIDLEITNKLLTQLNLNLTEANPEQPEIKEEVS